MAKHLNLQLAILVDFSFQKWLLKCEHIIQELVVFNITIAGTTDKVFLKKLKRYWYGRRASLENIHTFLDNIFTF